MWQHPSYLCSVSALVIIICRGFTLKALLWCKFFFIMSRHIGNTNKLTIHMTLKYTLCLIPIILYYKVSYVFTWLASSLENALWRATILTFTLLFSLASCITIIIPTASAFRVYYVTAPVVMSPVYVHILGISWLFYPAGNTVSSDRIHS